MDCGFDGHDRLVESDCASHHARDELYLRLVLQPGPPLRLQLEPLPCLWLAPVILCLLGPINIQKASINLNLAKNQDYEGILQGTPMLGSPQYINRDLFPLVAVLRKDSLTIHNIDV